MNTPSLLRPAVPRGSVPTDTELVARCRRGDHGAWRLLHDRHAPTVYRFLSALGVPTEEREDACQDVFVAVYRSLDRFRGAARLSTWIYRIAGCPENTVWSRLHHARAELTAMARKSIARGT